MPKVRVGIVDFLNSKPLAWGFLKGRHGDLFAPSYHSPSQVARLLAEGEIDVGLIPSVELQRIPDLEVLPDLCVSSTHEVRSVLLVSKGPVEEIRTVAVDRNSRTSVALLEILLREAHGLEPELVEHRPEIDRMLAAADAALVIGDPALHIDRDRFQVLDLAGEWKKLTGLPFVFAVWAVRAGVSLPDLPSYFKTSLRFGLDSLNTLSRESAAELGLEVAEVETYLTENLGFHLGAEELAGLTEFFRRARAHGLIPPPREIQLRQA